MMSAMHACRRTVSTGPMAEGRFGALLFGPIEAVVARDLVSELAEVAGELGRCRRRGPHRQLVALREQLGTLLVVQLAGGVGQGVGLFVGHTPLGPQRARCGRAPVGIGAALALLCFTGGCVTRS